MKYEEFSIKGCGHPLRNTATVSNRLILTCHTRKVYSCQLARLWVVVIKLGMKQSCARFIAYRGEYNLHSVQDTSYATSTTLMFSSHVNTFCNCTGQLNGEVLCSIPAKQKATPNSITGKCPCLCSEIATIYYLSQFSVISS